MPGDVVTIVLPVAVNREYLPTERYLLRNITVQPNIPTDATVSNWPFDLINASYTRHLDDMSYNSTAEIYYDFRISQFATKGAYPVNFEVNATVWRMDDANGTTVTEDVTFDLCVYVTIMDNGSESGETTAFGPLQVSASNQSGAVSLPTAQPSQQVTIRVPVINKGGTLTDVTVTPVVSSSLDEFPFVAASTNYGKYFPDWEMGESNILEWTFQVSPYATDGNKVLTFRANYFENGESAECTFTSQISITNGYSAETEEAATAMSVMVTATTCWWTANPSPRLLPPGRRSASDAAQQLLQRYRIQERGEPVLRQYHGPGPVGGEQRFRLCWLHRAGPDRHRPVQYHGHV